MSNRELLIGFMLTISCLSAHEAYSESAPSKSRASDDADYAVNVFEADLVRCKQLAQKGAISSAELQTFEDRLAEARIVQARARGDKTAVVALLKNHVDLLRSTLKRLEQLGKSASVSLNQLDAARSGLLDAELDLATAEENREKRIELLENRVVSASQAMQRLEALREKNVVSATELALQRLELAKAKNRVAEARGQ